MKAVLILAILAVACLAKTHTNHTNHTNSTHTKDGEDKASQIIDDVSKGVDVAQKIANLIKGFNNNDKSGSSGSGSEGNQEFDLEADNQLAAKNHTKKSAKKDKISEILGDISKGADAAKKIESLFGHGSGSEGNQEFDLFGDDELGHKKNHVHAKKHAAKKHAAKKLAKKEHKVEKILKEVTKDVKVAKEIKSLIKKHHGHKNHGNQEAEFDLVADYQLAAKKEDKISQILGDVSKGADVAKQIEGLFGHGSGSQGNQEFDLVADNQLAKKTHTKKNSTKKHSKKEDKISQILGDVSKGADVAKKIEGLFGHSSGSQGNQEFDLVADNQFAKKNHTKKHASKKDKISQILGDISKGADVAKQIEGLFGHHNSGSSSQGSQGNQEFDFGVDAQFDKASQIIDDVSKGVDVAQQIANLIKGLKNKGKTQKTSTGSSSSSGSQGSQGNQEFDLTN